MNAVMGDLPAIGGLLGTEWGAGLWGNGRLVKVHPEASLRDAEKSLA